MERFAVAIVIAVAVGLTGLIGLIVWRIARKDRGLTPIERAYVAYDDGRKQRAAALVERILRKTPGSETALYLRVLIDIEDADPADLAARVRPLLPGMKRPAATALLLAQAFLQRGDERSAQFWFDVARTDPTFEAHLDAMPLRDQLAMRLGGQERSYQ